MTDTTDTAAARLPDPAPIRDRLAQAFAGMAEAGTLGTPAQVADALLDAISPALSVPVTLADMCEEQRKLSARRLEQVRALAEEWAHGKGQPPASLAACGVQMLDIVAPYRSRIGDPEGAKP